MITKEVSSKILDDAREKIAEKLYLIDHPNVNDWEKCHLKELYRARTFVSLPLSGTTDIECPICKGSRRHIQRGGIDDISWVVFT